MSYTEIQAKRIKAGRKDYRCEWCDESIPKGTEHHYRFYVWDGDRQHGRTHPECWEAMGKAKYYDIEDGWEPGVFERGSCYMRCS